MARTPGPAEQLAFLHALCDRIPNAALYQVLHAPGAFPRFVYASAGIEPVLGVTPEQVLGDPAAFQALMHPDDVAAFEAARVAAEASGGAFEHTYRQRTAAGEVRWIYLRSVPTRLADGSTAWNGVLQDVTEARSLHAALEESEARFRAFMDHSPAVAWMKDADGRHVYVNRSFEERLRTPRADWLGKTDTELWPADVARQFQENDRLVLRDNRTVETVETTVGADGTVTRWRVFKFPVTDAAGRRYVGGIGVDVTERERVEGELRRTNEELRAALDRVRRLENSLVTMCAWTRTVKMGDRWVPVEEFLRATFGVQVTHGISDDALRKLEAEHRADPPT